jgi:hypothetical protein
VAEDGRSGLHYKHVCKGILAAWFKRHTAYESKPTAGGRDDQRTLTKSGPAKINAKLIFHVQDAAQLSAR